MKTVKILILSISFLWLIVAFTKLNTKKSPEGQGKTDTLVQWYGKLLAKSLTFLEKKKNVHFKESVQLYIDTCKEYNFKYHTRLEPYICQPILFNKTYDKAIVLILSRKLDLAGQRLEYIMYVSAKYEKGRWKFKVKKGHSDTFGYFKNYPTMSDTEIGMNIVDRLMQYGHMNSIDIHNDKLFNSPMYVLK